MTKAKIQIPPKLIPLFKAPRGALRFRCAYGGRGSGKSATFALMAAVLGYMEPLRILCTREMQNSIKESMLAEIKGAIERYPFLAAHYEVGESYIKGKNGTEFIFRGLRHNISAIKSMAAIDLCIVEEAEDVPGHGWRDLLPTIRAPRSEVWCVWNPRKKHSPVDDMFRRGNNPPRSMVVEVNYHDNPWFPEELEEQRRHLAASGDHALYRHIWEGAYLENSRAQVFADRYRVADFEPGADWDGPYYGLDFGFAQDPTAGIKCWVYGGALYIERELYQVGLELDATAAAVLRELGPEAATHVIRADCARPESISYLARHGLPRIEPVKKWPGSVEDGVSRIKAFTSVIIHSRCIHAVNEFASYSYRVDRLTGDVLPDLVDKDNHLIDAGRYAIAPLIRAQSEFFVG